MIDLNTGRITEGLSTFHLSAMKNKCSFFLLIWIMAVRVASAQSAPFTGKWSFEGNDTGTSSNTLVALSAVSYTGVNKFGPNPYTSGNVGLAVNVQNWSTTLCNQTEYVQFSVQAVGTATITLTMLSFAFSRAANGPQQISVRSSADGFSSDIFSQATATTYQVASIALVGPGFTNQAGPITFRIYACNPLAGGATLHLDEIQLNGASLPVTLLSFTAKPEGDRVQLAWATTAERDADQFIVERSQNLSEYTTVGQVTANGTTAERQYYGLTDLNPKPGVNYYRLKQVDRNGVMQNFKPIAALIQVSEPAVAVYPNPANTDHIHLRLWNADDAQVWLLNETGQYSSGQLDRTPGAADFRPAQPLPTGLYWMRVITSGQEKMIKVLVR